MSNITTWIEEELYPTLFDNIPEALPEHNFKRYNRGWRSNTYLNGTSHKRVDKTVVTAVAPAVILEQGGGAKSIVNYVIERDNIAFIDAVKKLSSIAGIEIPRGDIDPEAYKAISRNKTLLEELNSYFIYLLLESDKGGAERDNVLSYLKGRGYSIEDVKAMGLGYVPSQERIYSQLKKKGYTKEEIDKVGLLKAMGSTHRISIPYRSGNNIKGFKIRTIGDHSPKYYNTKGLDRDTFFNLSPLKGDKDLLIVEGELDSLHATAKGIENVVSAGGSSISPSMVEDAIKKGAKRFTLCLDYEPNKEKETQKNIERAVKVFLEAGVEDLYIMELPAGEEKVDLDSFLKDEKVNKVNTLKKEALSYYNHYLGKRSKEFNSLSNPTNKDLDTLKKDLISYSVNIVNPINKEDYKNRVAETTGIDKEAVEAVVEEIAYNRNKSERDKEFRATLQKVNKLQVEGKVEEAIDVLEAQLKEVKVAGAVDLLPPPLSFNNLLRDIAETTEAYNTGYKELDQFVGFATGAITLVAGRPSHGKTSLMLNFLLNNIELYPAKKFYFFTYEEPLKNIATKLLNILANEDLRPKYQNDLPKQTNYEFIKRYIREERTDIASIDSAMATLSKYLDSGRLTIIDRSYSVEELQSLLLYLNKKEDIGVVFIDYIQRMSTTKRTQDKRTEVAHISDTVLQIAKDTDLPIVLGAQLNRESDTNPTLKGLKEAGNLEEDANTVLSIFNEAKESERNEEGEDYRTMRDLPIEVKALKNREGDVGRAVLLDFDKYTLKVNEAKNYDPFK